MDCSVCCEVLTSKGKHQLGGCPFCDFVTCRECVQTYLLGLTTLAKCMNCNKIWTRENVESTCGYSFTNNEYKLHKEILLFEREKALMPQTQDKAKVQKKIDTMKKLIDDMKKYIKIHGNFTPEDRERSRELNTGIHQLENKIYDTRRQNRLAPEPVKIK